MCFNPFKLYYFQAISPILSIRWKDSLVRFLAKGYNKNNNLFVLFLISMPTEQFTWVITGGAGFIGSHLARHLVHSGQRVRVFDNFSGGFRSNLADIVDKIDLIEGDIRDWRAVQQALEGADYVLHHAALVSVPESVEKPLVTEEVNVRGTAHVLEAARRQGVRRVVFASSSAVYGNRPELPYREDTPEDCQSPYAWSKLAGAKLCALYTRIYKLETVVLRYFNVFGPGQNPHSAYAAVIAKFMQLAAQNHPLGIDWDGQQSRDFVNVRDVVQANLLAALKAQPGETYNVASGKTTSLLELADLVERISGRTLGRVFRPKRPGDVKLSSADISKIQRLGFVPRVTLEEGLLEMWRSKTESR